MSQGTQVVSRRWEGQEAGSPPRSLWKDSALLTRRPQPRETPVDP